MQFLLSLLLLVSLGNCLRQVHIGLLRRPSSFPIVAADPIDVVAPPPPPPPTHQTAPRSSRHFELLQFAEDDAQDDEAAAVRGDEDVYDDEIQSPSAPGGTFIQAPEQQQRDLSRRRKFVAAAAVQSPDVEEDGALRSQLVAAIARRRLLLKQLERQRIMARVAAARQRALNERNHYPRRVAQPTGGGAYRTPVVKQHRFAMPSVEHYPLPSLRTDDSIQEVIALPAITDELPTTTTTTTTTAAPANSLSAAPAMGAYFSGEPQPIPDWGQEAARKYGDEARYVDWAQLYQYCMQARQMAERFHITDLVSFARNNCLLIRFYYGPVECSTINRVIDYCQPLLRQPAMAQTQQQQLRWKNKK